MPDKKILSPEELKARDKLLIKKITSDEKFAYYFFHEKCRPLFNGIMWTIYGNEADYDELVNDLYLYLKKPNKEGENWHSLNTFDFRTSLFDWIKIVAIRHFYTPSNETFNVPEHLIETGIFEDMIRHIENANIRIYLWLKYIDKIEDAQIADELRVEKQFLSKISRQSVKQLKKVVELYFQEYQELMFSDNSIIYIPLENLPKKDQNAEEDNTETSIDVKTLVSMMPNPRYKLVITRIFLEGKKPEELAIELNTPVSNIYNIKSRALDQLRDIILFSNEISGIENYINEISDDIKRGILYSIFIKQKDYESVFDKYNISEVKFKKIKKEAIKELKHIIFKA